MKVFNIYAVKDELTTEFMNPIFVETEEIAKRAFATQINTISIWKDNPADFSLYKLGAFDQETGNIVSNIEKICGGRSVVRE